MTESDIFDAVVDLEGRSFEQGRLEGIEAAKEDDMFDNGSQAGFMRAFAIGLEVGFIESAGAILLLDKLQKESELSPSPLQPPPEDVNGGDSEEPSNTKTSSISSGRSLKRIVSMVEKAQQIPNVNDASVDFDTQVRELRVLYRLCGTNLGQFYRPPPSNESGGGRVQVEAVSREW